MDSGPGPKTQAFYSLASCGPLRFLFWPLLTFKIKQPVILPAKWVYLEIAEELQARAKNVSKSSKQRREMLLSGEKGRMLGGMVLNKKKVCWRNGGM